MADNTSTDRSLPAKLRARTGAFSDAGVKPDNEDCFGSKIPEEESLLTTKGIAVAVADGISSSDYGKEASHACVSGFLSDYYCTPETWSVKKSAWRVLTAINTWLYMQGHNREATHRGHVSTLSIVVAKSTTAHLIHIGDSRIYHLREDILEQMTSDHKVWLSSDKNYLSRAIGADTHLEIDYSKIALEKGDVFVLTTDGIHDHVTDTEIRELIKENNDDPDKAAELIARKAVNTGSRDNVTCQILRIDELPSQEPDDVHQQLTELPFPPELSEGMILDGYRIIREIHTSNRSQLYLARDPDTGLLVALKTPSVNYEDDPAYIERFTLEEWIGIRIDNAHVVKTYTPRRRRRFLYHVTEYVEGSTLRQWQRDHPEPDIETVRSIVEQIASGLQAFHRLEMLHQDLKPENIMIDKHGTVKLVDFGSARVAGISEISTPVHHGHLLGTKNYTAPEYAGDHPVSTASDIYSLGVITYELLTGKLPYGKMPWNWKNRNLAAELHYQPATDHNRQIPDWVDAMLHKAVAPRPENRYLELSEFLYDLRHPNPTLHFYDKRPLLERQPVLVWKTISALLFILVIALVYFLTH